MLANLNRLKYKFFISDAVHFKFSLYFWGEFLDYKNDLCHKKKNLYQLVEV